LKKHTFL